MIAPKVYQSYTLTGAELALARAGEFGKIRTAEERADATEHIQERASFNFNYRKDNPKKDSKLNKNRPAINKSKYDHIAVADIEKALEGRSQRAAAELLGMDTATMRYHLKKLKKWEG